MQANNILSRSAFFKTPLLSVDAVERKMRAVDSEHKNNLPAENWRTFQLLKSLADKKHTFSKVFSIRIPREREKRIQF